MIKVRLHPIAAAILAVKVALQSQEGLILGSSQFCSGESLIMRIGSRYL